MHACRRINTCWCKFNTLLSRVHAHMHWCSEKCRHAINFKPCESSIGSSPLTHTHTLTTPIDTHSHRYTPASWAINRTAHLTSSFPEAREDGSSDFGVSSLVRINGKRRSARGKESSRDTKINQQFNRFGRGRQKKGDGRIPPLFYLKKQHFDLTLRHVVYISQFYWSFSLWQERLQWEQIYFQTQDHTTTVSLHNLRRDLVNVSGTESGINEKFHCRASAFNCAHAFVKACTQSLCAIWECQQLQWKMQINKYLIPLAGAVFGRGFGMFYCWWWWSKCLMGENFCGGSGWFGAGCWGGTPLGQCPRLGIDTIERASFRLIKWVTASGCRIEYIDPLRREKASWKKENMEPLLKSAWLEEET